MMFNIKKNSDTISGKVAYSTEGQEIKVQPSINSDITFLIAYLQLGFDSENMLSTQISGYLPYFNWEAACLAKPLAVKGRILLCRSDIEPGDSVRIPNVEYWKIQYDNASGWLRYGNVTDLRGITYVEIFQNELVGLNSDGHIEEIWLKPVWL
ncbi:TPA: hypothetical protein TUW49_001877 [Streptococcus equi subsp. zooepidemicus]|uniref:hypothetical protein n=1 Tax=Streptococcus equi TaxID=1336 RepID=UPI0013F59D14|nr:hypothetical protein [Streptococcus equi]MCD3408936.1 hypothetical protein [Streptococcus equi subsp. zooepidemicus]MCD3445874.1 hypothetical protein [Streptococcus equi subsp. zooepidemicus]MCD3447516.1 hypothetical protein [Streptococcus equi subsp. zooepidemicus]HEL0656564.1 hypothetical protein [Streptococcus equi subsp. zooepidemicus]HEL0711187.1 hypothetical protein [Streptococcus equi subsp. zooepidemicus]